MRSLRTTTAGMAAVMTLTLATGADAQLEPEPRIVNGARVDSTRHAELWGFTVGLVRRGLDPGQGHLCGGTLVAPDVVVTAAHCVEDESASSLYVYGGSNSLIGPYPSAQHRAVTEIVVHPAYDGFAADLALMRLATPLIAPLAGLPPVGSDVGAGTPAQVAGWGCNGLTFRSTSSPDVVRVVCDDASPTLHEASAPIVDERECEQNYVELVGSYDAATQRCAGSTSAPGAAPAPCFGDSGGPLVVRTNSGPLLIGVVSLGALCGFYPGVYADVVALRGFIDEVLTRWATAPALPAVPAPPEPAATVVPGTSLGTFTPVPPTRLSDTRGSVALEPGIVRTLKVGGFAGVPLTGAGSAVLNLTVANPEADGYLSAYPCDQAPPLASNVNYRKGETVANAVQVGLDDGGDVCFVSFAGTDLVVDVAGWSSSELDADDVATRLTPIAPRRLLDTRVGRPKPEAGAVIEIDVTDLAPNFTNGVLEIPTAVTLNLTATEAEGDGYLTAYPCGSTPPLASNVNYRDDGPAISNAVVVATTLDIEGDDLATSICVSTYADTHIVVDATGWFGLPLAVRGGRTVPVAPTRLVDTRESEPVEAGGVLRVPVVGSAGVPVGATGAIVNVTAVDPRAAGYLTAYACDQPVPATSTVNHAAGVDVPNLAYAPLSAGGELCILSYADSDVVVDITGFVAP